MHIKIYQTGFQLLCFKSKDFPPNKNGFSTIQKSVSVKIGTTHFTLVEYSFLWIVNYSQMTL